MKYVSIIALILLLSCSNNIDESNDRTAILSILAQEKKAHVTKDADLFLSEFEPKVYSVNKGRVDTSSIAVHKQHMQTYFSEVSFIKWDDVAPPIIQFSNDHSLAYAIVQKQVILERKDSTGKKFTDTTNFAWTSIYRKQKSEWKLECNTSTNQ